MNLHHYLGLLVGLSIILAVSGQYQALVSFPNKPVGPVDPFNRPRVKYYQVNPIQNRIRTTKRVRRINRLSRQIDPDTVVTFANVNNVEGRRKTEDFQDADGKTESSPLSLHQPQESSSGEDAILEKDIDNEAMKISMQLSSSKINNYNTTIPGPSILNQGTQLTPPVFVGLQNLPGYGFLPGLQPYLPGPSYNPVFYPAYLEPDNAFLSPIQGTGLFHHNTLNDHPSTKGLESIKEIIVSPLALQVKQAEDGTRNKKPTKQDSGKPGSGILNSFLNSATGIAGAQVGSQLASGVLEAPPGYGPQNFRPQGYGGQGFGNQGAAFQIQNNHGLGYQAYGNQGFQGQRPNNGYGSQGINQFPLTNTLGTLGYINQGFNGQAHGYGGQQGIQNQGYVYQGYPENQGLQLQGNNYQKPPNQGHGNIGFSNQGNSFGSQPFQNFQGSSFGGFPNQGFNTGYSSHQNQDYNTNYFRSALPFDQGQTRILPLAPVVANQISNFNPDLGTLSSSRTDDKNLKQNGPFVSQGQFGKGAYALPAHQGFLVFVPADQRSTYYNYLTPIYQPHFYPGFRNAEEKGNQILEKTGVVKEATLNTEDSSNEALEQIEATKASEDSNPETNEDIQNLITIRQPIFIVSTSGLSQNENKPRPEPNLSNTFSFRPQNFNYGNYFVPHPTLETYG